ncbi:MAG: hypothetical protein WB729_08080 [Candidatus Sulfotelmatobacter sp.]|jgi:hypothetical protein
MEHEDPKKHASLVEAAKTLQNSRTGVVLSGRIVNGKVELDQATLDEIARKFGGANKSFVAVNAPFDPETSLSCEAK